MQSTDREIWRKNPDDPYSPSISVTEAGMIQINVGGHVLTHPIEEWWKTMLLLEPPLWPTEVATQGRLMNKETRLHLQMDVPQTHKLALSLVRLPTRPWMVATPKPKASKTNMAVASKAADTHFEEVIKGMDNGVAEDAFDDL